MTLPPAVREARKAVIDSARDASGYVHINVVDAVDAFVTALCAWQRAQDIQALREKANQSDGRRIALTEHMAYMAAARHLEALK